MSIDAFEPNRNECERQAKSAPAWIHWHPVGLAKTTGTHTLHVPKRTTGASLYPPNPDFLERFGNTDYWGEIREVPVECYSFKEFLDRNSKSPPQLIKLDTQGSELDILSSLSQDQLGEVLCVETEVEFQSIYKGQPLFGDLHAFMTENGFDLLDLRTARCNLSKSGVPNFYLKRNMNTFRPNPRNSSFLVAGDALYFKTSGALKNKPNLVKGIICAMIYRYYDLAFWLLDCALHHGLITKNESDRLNLAVKANIPSPRLRDRNDLIGWVSRTLRKSLGISDRMTVFWMEREWPNL